MDTGDSSENRGYLGDTRDVNAAIENAWLYEIFSTPTVCANNKVELD